MPTATKKPRYFKGHGALVAKFAEERLIQTKGRWAGQPLLLEQWQKELLDELYLVDENGKRVYREALIGLPRKNGKLLADDTPVPTPDGWTTHGELRPGDKVFGADGKPVTVVAVGPPQQADRLVVLQGGLKLLAHAEHEWLTDDRERGWGVRETRELEATLNAANGKRHRIPVAGPLDLPEADLPLDPYTFGVWLGDGHTDAARITNCDPEVWAAIPFETGGVYSRGATRTLLGLRPILREMGVLGYKHIPMEYLRASVRQRMALLRGLMDTDGTISKRGLCEFDTTNQRLLADVLDLIRGLGFKANVVSRRAKLRGVDCGPKWTIQFTAYSDRPVFTIPRKLERQKPPPKTRTRSQVHVVTDVLRVAPQTGRCIQVDAEDGLYLAGEGYVPTHNSTLAAAIALHGLVASGEGGPEVYAAAASVDQARIVFSQAREYVEASPYLRQWLRPLRSVIRCPSNNGIFRVLSADGPLAHGLNPSLVVIDELHAHKDPELYYALTTGVIAREEPLVVSITTAGYNRDTICWDVYERGRELAAQGLDAMREAGFLFYWRAAPADAAPDDREAWKQANPSAWVTEEVLEREFDRLPEAVFRRLHLNQWTEAEDSWIRPDDWDACVGSPVIDPSEPVWAGVDIGLKRDASALVWVQWHGDKLHVKHDIRIPAPGKPLSAAENRARVAALAQKMSALREVCFDPWAFRESAEMLADQGIRMVQFDQTAARMAPASEHLYELVKEGRIVHDGSPVLRQQVLAAVASETERGWRISKRKSRERIDAAVALAMAADRALAARSERTPDIDDYRIIAL